MGTTDITRAAPRPTAHRIRDAWVRGHLLARVAVPIFGLATASVVGRLDEPVPLRVGLMASGALLAIAALVDAHERRLPNLLIGGALFAASTTAVVTLEAAVVAGAMAGCLLGGGLLLTVRVTRGVGMGDVKMAAAEGAGLGAVSLTAVPAALAVAAALASGFGLLMRRTSLPLGPALLAGWLAALIATKQGWLS